MTLVGTLWLLGTPAYLLTRKGMCNTNLHFVHVKIDLTNERNQNPKIVVRGERVCWGVYNTSRGYVGRDLSCAPESSLVRRALTPPRPQPLRPLYSESTKLLYLSILSMRRMTRVLDSIVWAPRNWVNLRELHPRELEGSLVAGSPRSESP